MTFAFFEQLICMFLKHNRHEFWWLGRKRRDLRQYKFEQHISAEQFTCSVFRTMLKNSNIASWEQQTTSDIHQMFEGYICGPHRS